MKKQKDSLLSYILTVSFIVLLIFFLLTLVFLSRMALDDAQLTGYVSSTQELLDELSDVQQDINKTLRNLDEKRYIFFPSSVDVQNYYVHSSETSSFVSFRLSHEVEEINQSLYVIPQTIEDFERGQRVLLESGEEGRISRIIFEKNMISVIIVDENLLKQIHSSEIRGIKLYEIN